MIESNSIFFFLVQRQDGTERDPCIPFGVADAIMLDGPHEAVVIDRSTRFTSRGFTKDDEGIDVIKRSFTVRGCRTQGGKERVKDLIGGHAKRWCLVQVSTDLFHSSTFFRRFSAKNSIIRL